MQKISGTFISGADHAKEMRKAIAVVDGLLSTEPQFFKDRHQERQFEKAKNWVRNKQKELDTGYEVEKSMGAGLDALIPPMDPHRQTGI